ncbi:transposase [Methanobrevibacter sp.]
MIRVAPVQRCLQSKLILEKPGDNLDDEHIAKLIVYMINDFEKKKPYLFHERNVNGKIGPKFQNELKELLGLYIFATFRLQRTCRKIESFLSDKNEACKYITNNKLPKKSKINEFKNEYSYLINEFLLFTVEFGAQFNLVDFKIVTVDSTTVEASVDEYRRLKYDQILYLENLILKYSKSKGKLSIWKKLRKFFYYKELEDKLVDLVEEIYKKLNKNGRELLIVALKSKKACKKILDFIEVLKDNCPKGKFVNLTDPYTKRVLLKKGKTMFGYLIQTVTDVKTGLIIMQNVVEEQTDASQLIKVIDYIQYTYDKTPQYLLADNGYYKIESLEYAFYNGITPIVPDRTESMNINGIKNDDPFAKHNMPFDSINNNFTCPYGQKLIPTKTRMIYGVLNNVYTTDKCPECPYKDQCAKTHKNRKLYEPLSPAFLKEKRIFQSSQGKKLYKLRPIFSEGNFADLKSHQEFHKSRRIGFNKVDIDLKLEAIVINIKKIKKHLNVTLI